MAKKQNLRINEEIDDTEKVRLIANDGAQMGVVPYSAALERAQDEEFDLVEIAPTATPPVCKLMDYGKYKYQQQKKIQDQRRKSQNTGGEIKQMRIKTFRIDPHDLAIKLKKSREFIEEGHRLLFTLMFRAREHQHPELGEKLLVEKVAGALEDVARIETQPRKDGRRMTMTLAPVPNLEKVLRDRKKAEELAKKRADAEAEAARREAAGEAEPDPAEEPVTTAGEEAGTPGEAPAGEPATAEQPVSEPAGESPTGEDVPEAEETAAEEETN